MKPVNADDPLRTTDHTPDSAAVQPTKSFTPDGADTGVAAGLPNAEGTRTYDPGVGDDSPTAAADRPMPSIPGYAIEGILGRGGMGIVYRARHLALKRTVALKMVLAGGHAGPRELARFRIEAEAVARLQHPNIVQIHEVGEVAGHPYCALEYVEGGSLAKRLGGQPLATTDQAVSLVEALARAMQLAHSRNVVHRDLKPANVLLMADGTPKVTDFGLARQLDDDSGQTQAGAVVGTPSYMAPEQAAGEAHAAGPPADVYALGAILYECLTGRPPHRGDSVVETLEQVRTKEPEPPRGLRPDVPRDLETICMKCLRKEPERRYASAEALAEDLRRWAAGEPIAARPVGSLERMALWIRRKPARAGLVLALVLLGVAVVTFIGVIAVREHQTAADLAGYNQDLLLAHGEKETALKQALKESARVELDRGKKNAEIIVTINGVTSGPYKPTSRIVAFGYAGNDQITVAPDVKLPAWLDGGDNNDVLKGGGGPNTILGRAGNDLLFGGAARDLLIGGTGQDVMFGNRGGDILIAGSTSFDNSQSALAAIMSEWTSNHSADERVRNLTGVSSPKFGKRLNGNVFLVAATVQNDDSANVAVGGRGLDLYFVNETGPNADFVIDQTRSKRGTK